MKKMVFVTDKSFPSYDEFISAVEGAGHEIVFASGKEEDTLIREGAGADIVVNSFALVTAKFINSLTKCTMILRTGVGVNTIDVEAATAKKIRVCYVPDYCQDEVADQTIALTLCAARKICFLDKRVRAGSWDSVEAGYVPRLSGCTFGLLGFGGIAKRVAKRIMAFDMKVIAYDPFLSDEEFSSAGVARAKTCDEVFSASDIISLNLPLNAETKYIINSENIGKMKDGVFIVNTARGPLIKEDDLVKALKTGKVCAAGLDVFEEEPLPAKSELRDLDNVIITPHSAYYSTLSLPELRARSLDEVMRVLEGRPSRIVYNKSALGL